MASTAETAGARRALDGRALLKEAGLTAAIVLALTVSVVGIRTVDVPGGVGFVTRFNDVILATVIAFVGRSLLILLRNGRPLPVLAGALPFALAMIGALLYHRELSVHAPLLTRFLFFESLVVDWLLAIAALVLAAVAALAAWRQAHPAAGRPAGETAQSADHVGEQVLRIARFVGPVVLVFALVFPFLPLADRRTLDIAILVATYVMLGWGLNIVVGLAGLLDLGYVAFYAVGAYSYTLLAIHFDLGFWVCLPFAGLMAAFAGILLGFPVLRLRGDYLAIVTLGFGEMVRVILLNWYPVTRGPDGISGDRKSVV